MAPSVNESTEMSGAPQRSAGATKNPMRQIILIVGAAIAIFLAFTAYSVHKSVQSDQQLAAIKEMYFPVLQGIEANIVRLDKMEELFMRSAMLGDRDPLDEAAGVNRQAEAAFEEITQIYPARKAEITKLRQEFKHYNDLATSTADNFLKHKGSDISAQAKQMTQVLTDLRRSITTFRSLSYGSFVKTLSDTQSAVKLNLYMGMALGVMNLCFMGVLVFFIRNNVKMMSVIAEQNATLERRVAERTAQLRQKTQDIQAMLQNMPQGVLTVLPGGAIHPEYSAYLETIFETKEIANKGLMSLVFDGTNLGADVLSQVDAGVFACIGEDEMNFEFNSHVLATEFDKTMPSGAVKSLELSWSPICDANGTIDKLMVCVRDVTEFKRLAGEANAQKRELEIIGEVLAVNQEKFQDFIKTANQFLADNEALIRQTPRNDATAVGLLFRNMHTIKGNARTYGLLHMTDVVHSTEQRYGELREDPQAAWEPAALLAQLAGVKALVDEYRHVNDVTLGRKGPGRRGSVERFLMVDKDDIARSLALVQAVDASDMAAMRTALAQVDQTLSLIGTERVAEALSSVVEAMPSLAKELGKEPPKVTITDHGIVVRNQIVGVLRNVFTHMFRNSLDHGLEPADERVAAGKSAAGHIQLSLAREGGHVLLSLRDDGRGLPIEKLRRKAIAAGLLAEGDASPPDAVAQLIFAAGFSTAAQVSEVSGRGVGMDAVQGFVTQEGGSVRVQLLGAESPQGGRPFELVISLPERFSAVMR
jgi:signal transduction histidine kinase/PAS domain-containing protein